MLDLTRQLDLIRREELRDEIRRLEGIVFDIGHEKSDILGGLRIISRILNDADAPLEWRVSQASRAVKRILRRKPSKKRGGF